MPLFILSSIQSGNAISGMKPHWTYSDIFDLEYFFHRDQEIKDSLLHQRDRSIFLELEEQEKSEFTEQQTLLLSWVKENRKLLGQEAVSELPGPLIGEALRLVMTLFPLFGVVAGLLAGLAFFSYSGTTPVNVFHFLFLFIFTQLLLVLILLFRVLLKGIGLVKQSYPVTFKLYTAVTARLASRLQQRLRTAVPGKGRITYQQIAGLARTVHYKYGSLLYWPLFSISQRTLVGFNAGLLAATLFRVTTSDLAFGWQSTVQFSSDTLFRGVKILALPWSWMFPESLAYPSLAAIEGSRIILKDGIYHLATQDLVSWWPFLLLCLLVYGLLFRILLSLVAYAYQQRCLRTINLDSTDGLSVIRRMQSPLISTQAASGEKQTSQLDETIDKDTFWNQGAPTDGPGQFPLLLLTAYDIARQSELAPVLSFLQRRGFTVDHQEIMMQDYPSDQLLLSRLEERNLKSDVGIFLLMESWMPPIGEVIDFIKKMRTIVHKNSPIYVGLVGKPTNTHHFTSPKPEECRIWKQKLDAFSDPFLKIFPYSEDENT